MNDNYKNRQQDDYPKIAQAEADIQAFIESCPYVSDYESAVNDEIDAWNNALEKFRDETGNDFPNSHKDLTAYGYNPVTFEQRNKKLAENIHSWFKSNIPKLTSERQWYVPVIFLNDFTKIPAINGTKIKRYGISVGLRPTSTPEIFYGYVDSNLILRTDSEKYFYHTAIGETDDNVVDNQSETSLPPTEIEETPAESKTTIPKADVTAEEKTPEHMIDDSNYSQEIKPASIHKLNQLKDEYPVDLKIEELESHTPNVKIHELNCHQNCKPIALALMKSADAAEKRLVKLENILSTVLRTLHRLGARMTINCSYFGGTSI